MPKDTQTTNVSPGAKLSHTDLQGPPVPPHILPAERWFADGVIKMQRGVDPNGFGIFATRPFAKGELIGRFGGKLVSATKIDDYVARIGAYGHHVHHDWYVCPEDGSDVAARGAINHSCEPNTGMSGSLELVAMRDIAASPEAPAEFLIDYAITGSPVGGFSGCLCGTASCRGTITRDDWRKPGIGDAYKAFLPPFKARALDPGSQAPCPLLEFLDQLPADPRPPKHLADQYDAVFFDAVGVLIDQSGALPKARDVLAELNMLKRPYFVVTNVSSGTDDEILARLQNAGLPIPSADCIVSAGTVTRSHVMAKLHKGRKVAYFGPDAAARRVLGPDPNLVNVATAPHFDDLVVLDEDGVDYHAAAENVLSVFAQSWRDTRQLPDILVANSDKLCPGQNGNMVLGPGMIVSMIEAAMTTIGAPAPNQVTLGKPGAPIFDYALEKAQTRNVLMVGDQMETDVKGAARADLDAALVTTGIGSNVATGSSGPTHVLPDLGALIAPV